MGKKDCALKDPLVESFREYPLQAMTTTRRALEESRCSQGLGLEQGAACHPPDPQGVSSLVLPSPWWRRLTALWANVSPFP